MLVRLPLRSASDRCWEIISDQQCLRCHSSCASILSDVFLFLTANLFHLKSVSKRKPGVHDINFEIESKDNAHFVVHDSQGFEPGEEQNFNIVTNFIEERKRKPELKDKLHAIWQVLVVPAVNASRNNPRDYRLCVEIPCSGGRVFEIGDENFINLHLGHGKSVCWLEYQAYS